MWLNANDRPVVKPIQDAVNLCTCFDFGYSMPYLINYVYSFTYLIIHSVLVFSSSFPPFFILFSPQHSSLVTTTHNTHARALSGL
jgi:hypothetical protein